MTMSNDIKSYCDSVDSYDTIDYETVLDDFAEQMDRIADYKIYKDGKLITFQDAVDNYLFSTMLYKSIYKSKLVTMLLADSNCNNAEVGQGISELFQIIQSYNHRYNSKGIE